MTAPLSLNDRQHHMVKARKVAEVRGWAGQVIRAARVPRCARVRVTLHYAPRDRRRRDPLNLVLTLKAVEDGMVDAGVVPDDDPTYVEPTMPRIDAPTGARAGRLYVVIEALPALPGTAEQPALL